MALFFGAASDGDIGGQQSEAEGQHQRQIDNKKQTASVLGRQVGEAPQVAYAYGTSGGGQNETDLSRKMSCFLFHNFCTPHL